MKRNRTALTNLKRTLRDERGTLIELQLLIVFVLLALALIPAYHSVWKAFGFAGLYFGGGLAALVGLGMLLEKLSDVAALQPVRRVLESGPVALLAAAACYLMGGVGFAVIAGFASIFIAPRLSSSPHEQLQAMRAITALGALAGFWIVYAARRSGPRF
jgi:hypothetical protein